MIDIRVAFHLTTGLRRTLGQGTSRTERCLLGAKLLKAPAQLLFQLRDNWQDFVIFGTQHSQ